MPEDTLVVFHEAVFSVAWDFPEYLCPAVANKVSRLGVARLAGGEQHIAGDVMIVSDRIDENRDGLFDVIGHTQDLANQVGRSFAQETDAQGLGRDSDIGEGMKTKPNYVAALADTLVAVDTSILAGQKAYVEISLVNNLPLDTIILPIIASNVSSRGFLDSIVTTGCRTAHLTPQIVFDNGYVGQLAVRMATNDPDLRLPPGEGPIARVWFRARSTAAPGDSIVVSTGTLGSYNLRFTTGAIAFTPVFHPGALSIGFIIGDLDFSEAIDAFDLSMLIEMVFFGAPMPTPQALADINCDGFVDAVDLSVLIEHVFLVARRPVSRQVRQSGNWRASSGRPFLLGRL